MQEIYFKDALDFNNFLKNPYYSLQDNSTKVIKVIDSVIYEVSTCKEMYNLIHKMVLFCKLFIFIIFSLGISLGLVFVFPKPKNYVS
jgi:hypothetical protein